MQATAVPWKCSFGWLKWFSFAIQKWTELHTSGDWRHCTPLPALDGNWAKPMVIFAHRGLQELQSWALRNTSGSRGVLLVVLVLHLGWRAELGQHFLPLDPPSPRAMGLTQSSSRATAQPFSSLSAHTSQEATEMRLWLFPLCLAAHPFKVSSWHKGAKGPEQNNPTRSCGFLHLLLSLWFTLLQIMPKFSAVALKMSHVLMWVAIFPSRAWVDATTLISHVNINVYISAD